MLRLDHAVRTIFKPRESLAFYRDVLGLPLVDAIEGPDWGGFKWLMLVFATGDGRELVFVCLDGARPPRRSAVPKDANHIALSTTRSLEPWRKKLRVAKIEFWEEEHGARRSLYFEDPNGFVIEVTSPPAKRAFRENAAAVQKALRWISSRARKRKPQPK